MAGLRIAEVLQNLARTGRINQGDGFFVIITGKGEKQYSIYPSKRIYSRTVR